MKTIPKPPEAPPPRHIKGNRFESIFTLLIYFFAGIGFATIIITIIKLLNY